MRPLVWLLADPAWLRRKRLAADEPMLIVANHVTAYDGPLVQYALPGRDAAADCGGHVGRDAGGLPPLPQSRAQAGEGRFYLPGPLFYLLLTALFNVFPLAPAAQLPAQFCACRRGHGPRIQRAGLSRGHALGGGHAGALPPRNRPAGQAIGSDGAAGGDSRTGRAEDAGSGAGSAPA